MLENLIKISSFCDGVRCDMAMLILNRIQKMIWGDRVFWNGRFNFPQTEFWIEAINKIKSLNESFVFIGEVYWKLEDELLSLGFDYVYNKEFYDDLRDDKVTSIKKNLADNSKRAEKRLNFIENHDEGRVISLFGKEKSKAAAVIMSLACGLRLFHQGQIEGFKFKMPLQLNRFKQEQIDEEIKSFYLRLLSLLRKTTSESNVFSVVEPQRAWLGNETYKNVIALISQKYLVFINYSNKQSQCNISLQFDNIDLPKIKFIELFSGNEFFKEKNQILEHKFQLDLKPYEFHFYQYC